MQRTGLSKIRGTANRRRQRKSITVFCRHSFVRGLELGMDPQARTVGAPTNLQFCNLMVTSVWPRVGQLGTKL